MNWPILRDILLFFGGLAGVGHEVLLTHTERPTLLILFAAMMGLPAFLQGGATGAADRGINGPEKQPKPKRHLRWVEDEEPTPEEAKEVPGSGAG